MVQVEHDRPQPSSVVQRALHLQDREAFDEVWCVFDRDDHTDFQAAIDAATQAGLQLAVSNASFELWLLLHFRDCSRHEERGDLVRLLREHVGISPKRPSFEDYRTGAPAAEVRAKQLEEQAHADGQPNRNPTTGMWRLVEAIRGR